jgi:hypothetical protein
MYGDAVGSVSEKRRAAIDQAYVEDLTAEGPILSDRP